MSQLRQFSARRFATLAVFGLVAILPVLALASPIPGIEVKIGGEGSSGVSTAMKMIGLLTVLSLAPAVLITMTSFTRIVVVFSFVRQALGVQGMPPGQVMVSLALFLTVFIMAPIGQKVHASAIQPYMNGEMSDTDALDAAVGPIRTFMLKQVRQKDLALFYELSSTARPKKPHDVAMTLLMPAFVISELRTAFEMGFMLFLPFLLVDLVVSSVVMSMGMVMLPPALIAMPVKIMLFVLADGWHLVVGSVARSFVV